MQSVPVSTKPAQDNVDAQGFTPALASILDVLAAMPADDLEIVNVDINAAVVTAIACVPELAPFRAEIARINPAAAEALDKLDVLARALNQAHARYLVNEGAVPEVAELSKRVVEMRALLFAEASVLVQRKLVDGEKLTQLKGIVGFRNQINDVLQLVEVLREAVANGRAGAFVNAKELDEAEAAAQALVVAMGKREQGPQRESGAADLRQRCFTLFVRSYDELRRVMSYLRWHEDDVDTLIPSLYGGRTRKAKEEPAQPATPPVVAAPTPSPVTDAGPAGPVDPSNPEGKPPARPGLPDSDPFTA